MASGSVGDNISKISNRIDGEKIKEQGSDNLHELKRFKKRLMSDSIKPTVNHDERKGPLRASSLVNEETLRYFVPRNRFLEKIYRKREELEIIQSKARNLTCRGECLNAIKHLLDNVADLEADLSNLELISRRSYEAAEESSAMDFQRISLLWNNLKDDSKKCERDLSKTINNFDELQRRISKLADEILRLNVYCSTLSENQAVTTVEELEDSIRKIEGFQEKVKRCESELLQIKLAWDAMKKNGVSNDELDDSLKAMVGKIDAMKEHAEILNTKDSQLYTKIKRIDEEMTDAKSLIDQLTSFNFDQITLTESDTVSDIQAKMSKLNQGALTDIRKSIENIRSQARSLPEELKANYEAELIYFDQIIERLEADFERHRKSLQESNELATKSVDIYRRFSDEIDRVEKAIPGRKVTEEFSETTAILSQFKQIEADLKNIKQNSLDPLKAVLRSLPLTVYRKPSGELSKRWESLLDVCWNSILSLSRTIVAEQSKAEIKQEIWDWIENTQQMAKEFTSQIRSDDYDSLKTLMASTSDFIRNVEERRSSLEMELDPDEDRTKMDKTLRDTVDSLRSFQESLKSVEIEWLFFGASVDRMKELIARTRSILQQSLKLPTLKELEITLSESLSELKVGYKEINRIDVLARCIFEKTGAHGVYQVVNLMTNQRRELYDYVEDKLNQVYHDQFVQSQIVSLDRQISFQSDVVARIDFSALMDEDIEKETTFLEDSRERSLEFKEELQKFSPVSESGPMETKNKLIRTAEKLKLLNDVISMKETELFNAIKALEMEKLSVGRSILGSTDSEEESSAGRKTSRKPSAKHQKYSRNVRKSSRFKLPERKIAKISSWPTKNASNPTLTSQIAQISEISSLPYEQVEQMDAQGSPSLINADIGRICKEWLDKLWSLIGQQSRNRTISRAFAITGVLSLGFFFAFILKRTFLQ